jgi:hypothetical protein
MKKFYLYIVAAVFAVLPLQAEHINPFVMPSARAGGFGGIHAAQGDDFSTIFSNPASFAGLEKEFSAAELTISLYGPVFEFMNLAQNASSTLDATSMLKANHLGFGFDVGGPLALGLVDNGFGFGIFNRTTIDAKAVDQGTPPMVLSVAAAEEILLVGGYSFRALERDVHIFDIGFLGKAFYRGLVSTSPPIDDIANMFDSGFSRPFASQFGIGLDLGMKYTYSNIFSVALAGYDVFAPALVTSYNDMSDYGKSSGVQSYATVKPRLALGLLYIIRGDRIDRHFSNFTVMLDYRDFVDLFYPDPRNPLLNISLGAEITMLKILRLRAGFTDALPSFGFGIDMTALKLDLAIRGKELGLDPWDQPVYAIDLGLLFRY